MTPREEPLPYNNIIKCPIIILYAPGSDSSIVQKSHSDHDLSHSIRILTSVAADYDSDGVSYRHSDVVHYNMIIIIL